MHNLTVLAFDNPTQAFQLRDALLQLQGGSLFELAKLVVVRRDTAGNVNLRQADGTVSGCASAGSVIGLIVGAVFALPWAGSAVGAGVGAVIDALSRFGIDSGFIKELGSTITPGHLRAGDPREPGETGRPRRPHRAASKRELHPPHGG